MAAGRPTSCGLILLLLISACSICHATSYLYGTALLDLGVQFGIYRIPITLPPTSSVFEAEIVYNETASDHYWGACFADNMTKLYYLHGDGPTNFTVGSIDMSNGFKKSSFSAKLCPDPDINISAVTVWTCDPTTGNVLFGCYDHETSTIYSLNVATQAQTKLGTLSSKVSYPPGSVGINAASRTAYIPSIHTFLDHTSTEIIALNLQTGASQSSAVDATGLSQTTDVVWDIANGRLVGWNVTWGHLGPILTNPTVSVESVSVPGFKAVSAGKPIAVSDFSPGVAAVDSTGSYYFHSIPAMSKGALYSLYVWNVATGQSWNGAIEAKGSDVQAQFTLVWQS